MRRILALSIAVLMIAGGCSAVSEDTSDIAADAPGADYGEVTAVIDEYTEEYGEFRNSTQGEGSFTEKEGTTPQGRPCTALFYASDDGVYRNAHLEISYSDGTVTYDEYFDISDDLLFFVRSNVDPDFHVSMTRYAVTGGVLYNIDDENETMVPITDTEPYDIYLSYAELEAAFGGS